MFAKLFLVTALASALWVGSARPTSGAGPREIYVVKPADTLWSIASSHYAGDPRAAIWRLEQSNRVTPATLVPGERLLLP